MYVQQKNAMEKYFIQLHGIDIHFFNIDAVKQLESFESFINKKQRRSLNDVFKHFEKSLIVDDNHNLTKN